MKKIYFILVVLWLSVSSVSAQNVFWGKTYKCNLDANTMLTYSVDKAGNAEYTISGMENNVQIRFRGKDKSTKKMLWAKLDENSLNISVPQFQNGKFFTPEGFNKAVGKVAYDDKTIAQYKKLAEFLKIQIVNITEDEIWLLADISGYESMPCKTSVFTLVK